MIRMIEITYEKIFQMSSIIVNLLEHCLITPVNLPIHIHYPLYNGPCIELGIVPVYTEFTAAIFGVPVKFSYGVVEVVGLHLLDRDCAIFGRP